MLTEGSDELKELLELAIKSGRRCAHDFQHAVDSLYGNSQHELFKERAKYWRSVFYPDKGLKNYKHELHDLLQHQEIRANRFKQQLIDNGIKPDDPDDQIPF